MDSLDRVLDVQGIWHNLFFKIALHPKTPHMFHQSPYHDHFCVVILLASQRWDTFCGVRLGTYVVLLLFFKTSHPSFWVKLRLVAANMFSLINLKHGLNMVRIIF